MYDNAAYARSRLNDTVVLYRKIPVYVLNVREDLRAVVMPIHKPAQEQMLVPIRSLNVLDLQLGFHNLDNRAVYLSRRPMRDDWRQGLRENNVFSNGIPISHGDIGRALMHDYPTLEESVELVSAGAKQSMAWCKEFCVSAGGVLTWKYRPVGDFQKGVFTLSKRYEFLQPSLKENLNENFKIA